MTNDKFQTGYRKANSGFTVVELMTTIGIVLILFSLSWINLTSLPSRATAQTDVLSILTDIKSQQVKAMSGDTGGGGTQSDYGIYFESTGYTIFSGSNYDPSAPSNYVVDLGNDNLSFSNITFPGQQIIFAKGSGETIPGQFSITDTLTGNVKTVRLNKYGATY